MHQAPQNLKELSLRCNLWLRAPLVLAGSLGAACVLRSDAAVAAVGVAEIRFLSPAEIFALLFLMLGPFKIIAPFLKITEGIDTAIARRTALQATVFASAALLIAGLLGDSIISKYSIPLPLLTLSAGVILFLVALQKILHQFEPISEAAEGAVPAACMRTAMMPLAFPTIVTPYGIAALVVFVSVAPDLQAGVLIGGIVLVIMLLNLIVMLTARRFQAILSVVLPIVGAVLGVIQVALGLKIINNSLRAMSVY